MGVCCKDLKKLITLPFYPNLDTDIIHIEYIIYHQNKGCAFNTFELTHHVNTPILEWPLNFLDNVRK